MTMRGVVSALVGLSAASLLVTPRADAAREAFQLAGGALGAGVCHGNVPRLLGFKHMRQCILLELRCGYGLGFCCI